MTLAEINDLAKKEIHNAQTARELESLRVKYLGRKGELTAVLRSLGEMPLEKRREIGPQAQALKKELEAFLAERMQKLESHATESLAVDLTAPGRRVNRGHLHPLTLVMRDMRDIFKSMNFSVVDGPEVETEYYNFDALNIPAFHPAREMWDTFWLKTRTDADGAQTDAEKGQRKSASSRRGSALLLRTHTSPVQVRYMEKHDPPFQIIVPGRVFRYEATDAGHEINFYQLEGLMVGKTVTLANFKFVIEEFFKKFFGAKAAKEMEFRYRPSYFPFVEPGLEVDIRYRGKWFEVAGAGMVNQRVFDSARYVPGEWQGFAFGVGVDRLAMIKYKIPDIRLFYSGDLRFVRQF